MLRSMGASRGEALVPGGSVLPILCADRTLDNGLIRVEVHDDGTFSVRGADGSFATGLGRIVDAESALADDVRRQSDLWLSHLPVDEQRRVVPGHRVAVDLERLGRQLEWLRNRLLDLAQERNRFLRHMSHELKTPLANIREGTELLMDGERVGQVITNLVEDAMKAAIVEKVFGASPRLYAELIAGNPYTEELLSIYETQLARLRDLLARKDIDGLAAALNPGKESP